MSWAPSCSGAGASRRALSLFGRAPAVYCVGDRRPVGRVEGRSTGPDGSSELLVRSGWWDPIVRRVPAVHVIRASSSGVVLRIDRERFVRLQRYLPDPELVDAVYHTLRTDALRYLLTRFVGIHARNGVIRASGNLVSEAHRQAALRAIAATPGVLRVEDELATDERITSAIALAMLPHRTLQPSRVHVRSSFGSVSLEGELDSRRDVVLAVGLAAAVRGVVEVRSDRLTVRRPRPPQPARAARSRPGLVRIVAISVPRWILVDGELIVTHE